MQLNRKLQALTDHPSRGFIRMLRLKRAAQLLQQSAGTVTEICYDVGFNNLSHFAKAFREQFGQSPSEYAASFTHEE
jgi:AraC-like DNA-binding protein